MLPSFGGGAASQSRHAAGGAAGEVSPDFYCPTGHFKRMMARMFLLRFFFCCERGVSASMKQLRDWGVRLKGIGHVSLSGGGIGGIIPRWDAQHLSLINQLLVLFVKKLVCRGTQNVLSGFGVSRQP
jgi:hypothetical protein